MRDVEGSRNREADLAAENERLRHALAQATSGDAATLAALRANERRSKQILDSAIDYAIITMALDGTVLNWNTGAEAVLGWTEAEMHGRSAAAFFTFEDRKAGVPESEMRIALAEGRATDERWHLRKDGSEFWASGEMMPLRSEEGAHQGYSPSPRGYAGLTAGMVSPRLPVDDQAQLSQQG